MVEFLKKIRTGLFNEKLELESEQHEIRKKINEHIKLIKKLKEEDERNYDAFSPRKQNTKYRDEVKQLDEKKSAFIAESKDIETRLKNINSILNELNEKLKAAKRESIALQMQSDQKQNDEIGQWKEKILETVEAERQKIARDFYDAYIRSLSYLHKVDFCLKLFEIDPVRCKMELELASKGFHQMGDEMQEMISDLHPLSLEHSTLEDGLRQSFTKINQTGKKIHYTVKGKICRLKPVVALTMYRTILEICDHLQDNPNSNEVFVTLEYGSQVLKITLSGKKKSNIPISVVREKMELLSGTVDILADNREKERIVIQMPVS